MGHDSRDRFARVAALGPHADRRTERAQVKNYTTFEWFLVAISVAGGAWFLTRETNQRLNALGLSDVLTPKKR